VHRVNSCLGMTRSIGDILIKDKKQQQFQKEFSGELVIAEPEIQEIKITNEDEFIIIACDGVWDVFSSQEAVDFVHISLARKKKCQLIVEELVEMAIELGSLDNITVIILFLNHR
jgi:serine/threonine protein phosphatase PrpC